MCFAVRTRRVASRCCQALSSERRLPCALAQRGICSLKGTAHLLIADGERSRTAFEVRSRRAGLVRTMCMRRLLLEFLLTVIYVLGRHCIRPPAARLLQHWGAATPWCSMVWVQVLSGEPCMWSLHVCGASEGRQVELCALADAGKKLKDLQQAVVR